MQALDDHELLARIGVTPIRGPIRLPKYAIKFPVEDTDAVQLLDGNPVFRVRDVDRDLVEFVKVILQITDPIKFRR